MKKNKRYIVTYFLIIFLIFLIYFLSGNLFGSKVDWLGQHTAFLEYFRKQFYDTKNIFPNFSFQIGAGQNIYNFSYYGLYNPIFLLSLLLPFVSIRTYTITMMFILMFIGTTMIFYFLKDKTSPKIAFISGIIYLLASPIIFHSHRHIMFVSYMPLLIMGLFGIDLYNKDDSKIILIILSTFLMILTSYYYSIEGILVLFIYYLYISKLEKKKVLKLIFILFISVTLAAFFLLPTAYALVHGRTPSPKNIDIISLFIPKTNLSDVLYTPYSLGISSIYIFTLIYFIICKDKKRKYLGVLMTIISFLPLSSFILNGFLYAREKVLIPFLPLIIYMISIFIKDLFTKKININPIIIITLILNIILLLCKYYEPIYYIDNFMFVIALILYAKTKKQYLIIIPILSVLVFNSIYYNTKENYVPKDYKDISFKVKDYYRTNNLVNSLYQANDGLNYSTNIYSSVYNPYYYDLYNNIFNNALEHRNKLMTTSSNNILFEHFMGVKYLISKQDNLLGFEKIKNKEGINLLKNDSVFSIGYASNNLMSTKEFKKLKYPYNVDAIMNNIVVPDGKNKYNKNIEKYDEKFIFNKSKNLKIKQDNKIYKIKSNNGVLYLNLEKPLNNKILLIDFDVLNDTECSNDFTNNDLNIDINNISNKLTCKDWEYKNDNHHFSYVISENDLSTLKIKFKKGYYEIGNINDYIIDYDHIKNIKHNNLNIKYMKDNTLVGDINVKKDGYFNLSIPYDEGFSILVDGKKQKYEKVNIDLIGFKIRKGKHKIVIKYNSPYLKIGLIISFMSLIIIVGLLYMNIKQKNV